MLRQLKINNPEHLRNEMLDCNVDPSGIKIMSQKGEFLMLKTSPIPVAGCNILKQQMLSIGGEVAISKGAANCRIKQESAIIFGTRKQFNRLIRSLDYQCFGLKELQQELSDYFNNLQNHMFFVGNKKFDLSKRTLVMGILNVTPDSFSDGGEFEKVDMAVSQAMKMIDDGVDIIDIGGESTRPGAQVVSVEEEINRILPVIDGIRKKSDIPISIDSYKSQVAKQAISVGAGIVNDISGLRFDKEMSIIIAKNNASAVLMHIQGTPESMQKNPKYKNIFDDILKYLIGSAKILTDLGVEKARIVLDPGIGFGKKWEQNFEIIRHLEEFKSAGYPLLIGTSRKSFIGNLLDLPISQRLEGTLSSIACCIMNGAGIVRVHDVKECVRAVKVADKIVGKS